MNDAFWYSLRGLYNDQDCGCVVAYDPIERDHVFKVQCARMQRLRQLSHWVISNSPDDPEHSGFNDGLEAAGTAELLYNEHISDTVRHEYPEYHLTAGRRVLIGYEDAHGKVSQRFITPLSFNHERGTFIAHCEKASAAEGKPATRMFRFERLIHTTYDYEE